MQIELNHLFYMKTKFFTSIVEAQQAAEKLKKERGETAPRRCT